MSEVNKNQVAVTALNTVSANINEQGSASVRGISYRPLDGTDRIVRRRLAEHLHMPLARLVQPIGEPARSVGETRYRVGMTPCLRDDDDHIASSRGGRRP